MDEQPALGIHLLSRPLDARAPRATLIANRPNEPDQNGRTKAGNSEGVACGGGRGAPRRKREQSFRRAGGTWPRCWAARWSRRDSTGHKAPARVRLWLNGQFVEQFEMTLRDGPADSVVESKKLVDVPTGWWSLSGGQGPGTDGAGQADPGVALLDPVGKSMGTVGLFETKELRGEPAFNFLVRDICGARGRGAAAARQETELRVREEKNHGLARKRDGCGGGAGRGRRHDACKPRRRAVVSELHCGDLLGENLRITPAGKRAQFKTLP